ncbi:MAG: acetaldehyde dehydrogenase (acetylating) [Deltaproteobacteria bacterium]|nr:acetaldehyde dehydrogenase (acetylating) [Deltaproteobacteria bacterium]
MEKIKAAILGPGNIGSDLMYKIMRSRRMQVAMMAGIVDSPGIQRAKSIGIPTTTDGIGPILDHPEIRIVFDSTGARPHLVHAPLLKEAGKLAVDLTPAAIGPYVVPAVNLDKVSDASNFNMVTCGGQATVPIVHAINRVAGVVYAEIVAAISSKSAGPGTRQNIDEFTQTTARALCVVGGAKKGKAIIVLNPAEPPLMMTDTVYVEVEKPDEKAIRESVEEMVRTVQSYVPGYRLRMPPTLDDHRVVTIVEVEGAGDFLPKYSGNLDIMTSAAAAVGEALAERILAGSGR